jgi:large subunit ribosomal protein L35
MGYKFKPNKAVAKRFKVTKTGKVKRHHAYTSHLMSARPANTRRKLRRSAIMHEGLARNMRALMGLSKMKPAQVEHERALAEKRAAKGEADGGSRPGAATRAPRGSRAASKAPAVKAAKAAGTKASGRKAAAK